MCNFCTIKRRWDVRGDRVSVRRGWAVLQQLARPLTGQAGLSQAEAQHILRHIWTILLLLRGVGDDRKKHIPDAGGRDEVSPDGGRARQMPPQQGHNWGASGPTEMKDPCSDGSDT